MNFCPNCGNFFEAEASYCPLDGSALERYKDPLIGVVLGGKYRLYRKIGEGGMGMVYYAVNVSVEREYAIKILPTHLAGEETVKKRFLREAKASNLIGHENIVQVYDVGESDALLYIVMELVEGESLEKMLERQGRLDVKTTIHILKQVCEALGVAHAVGVIPRDIKPANILIARRKENPLFVKILDLGLAQIMTDVRLTGKGSFVGTPYYVSPEQARGEKGAPSMDLYSLGCMAYEMLTGEPPFAEGSPTEIIVKHIKEAPLPLIVRAPQIPLDLERLVMRLLRKDPRERPRDAYEVLSVLDDLQPDEAEILEIVSPEDLEETLAARRRGMGGEKRLSGAWRTFLENVRKSASVKPEIAEVLPRMDILRREREALAGRAEEVMRRIETLQIQGGERQQRMGHALRELARDLSARGAAIAENNAKIRDLDGRMKETEGKIRGSFLQSEEVALFFRGGVITGGVERLLAESGVLLARWKEMREERNAIEKRTQQLDNEFKDLEYQIDSLRRELEMSNAQVEREIALLNAELATINEKKGAIEKELSDFAVKMSRASAP